ncbi:hypothetical protein BVC93_21665 [Mycobacterium sp. MS1601]|uniref:hypothetical protein n=1 Tax=Mycobacterium sp. MS1601 TaxID=1936029 RepID=UPI00097934C6|nr:hypothetical protein [Mycobacterium sp. MS1601]AQA04599.1 hypothetical protein BVC93_21665 [Mycobacterium sp. MS1601]
MEKDRAPVMSALTPALREEIDRLLHTSDPAFNHGEVLRNIEAGATVEQIAAKHRRTAADVEAYMKSLQHLLVGTIPASRSAARTNAAAYRELLARELSLELRSYAEERLQRLLAINPDATRVAAAPVRARVTKPKSTTKPTRTAVPEPTRDKMCPQCFTVHAGDCY